MKERGRSIDIYKNKQEMKKMECMKIYKANDPLLFSMGDEIIVEKKGMKAASEMRNEINKNEDHIVAEKRRKKSIGIQINPIRIIFIQMKDKKQNANRQEMCIASLTIDYFIGKLDDDDF